MALVKDGLWGIDSETEVDPGEGQAEAHKKFLTKERLCIVLSVEPSLLYLIGDPEDPV